MLLPDAASLDLAIARFEEKISEPAVREYFESLGLDIFDAWSFFKLLDLDAGGEVEIDEFLMGCLRLRGTARAIDAACPQANAEACVLVCIRTNAKKDTTWNI